MSSTLSLPKSTCAVWRTHKVIKWQEHCTGFCRFIDVKSHFSLTKGVRSVVRNKADVKLFWGVWGEIYLDAKILCELYSKQEASAIKQDYLFDGTSAALLCLNLVCWSGLILRLLTVFCVCCVDKWRYFYYKFKKYIIDKSILNLHGISIILQYLIVSFVKSWIQFLQWHWPHFQSVASTTHPAICNTEFVFLLLQTTLWVECDQKRKSISTQDIFVDLWMAFELTCKWIRVYES